MNKLKELEKLKNEMVECKIMIDKKYIIKTKKREQEKYQYILTLEYFLRKYFYTLLNYNGTDDIIEQIATYNVFCDYINNKTNKNKFSKMIYC